MNKIIINHNLLKKDYVDYVNGKISPQCKKKTDIRRRLEDLRLEKELAAQNSSYQ